MKLLVLAAGIGSRFGGVKQVAGVGPRGETLLEYSLYDARRAGFGEVVFLIRPDIEADFKATIAARLPSSLRYSLAYQTREMLLDDAQRASASACGRAKPWGTGHALLCARGAIGEGPFAVLNADDYYGRAAFEGLGARLSRIPGEFCFAAYRLDDVVPSQGSVSRAICEVDPEGYLERIVEHKRVWREAGRLVSRLEGGDVELSPEAPVSMNLWGFNASVFEGGARAWSAFLGNPENYASREFYLPDIVQAMMAARAIRVRAVAGSVRSFGLTNPEDLAETRRRLAALVEGGFYPSPLWEEK